MRTLLDSLSINTIGGLRILNYHLPLLLGYSLFDIILFLYVQVLRLIYDLFIAFYIYFIFHLLNFLNLLSDFHFLI
jgi:hypothetical protein